ncbi:Fe(3+)-hydroxamate ABC transporter permease FhuB [Faunimonas sp. B44]|uniref:Fe(3+)-hydroxamate ABC transporter permease FhuB n=1 Tax=Faunimonas sp. B44 TaxID=3461493 RepID=UPI004044E9CC
MIASRLGPPAVVAAFASLAVLLGARLWGAELLRLGATTDGFDVERMVLLHSSLPRAATALLCGAMLGLSGAILQQVLRNPLASPTTLGLSAGANLALALVTLLAPDLLWLGRDAVAIAGAAAAAAIVFAIGARRRFSPFALILAGLLVSLYCGALAAIIILFNERYLVSLFIWGAGSLSQNSWDAALALAPRLLVLAVLAGLLVRPLTLLDLDDAGAASLGLSPRMIRIAGFAVALCLAAFTISAVGVIGFVGLVSPLVARLSGARLFRERLIWSPAIGALLLLATDDLVQILAGAYAAFVPTGAVTALLGSPLLLALLPRLRSAGPPAGPPLAAHGRAGSFAIRLLVLCAILLGVGAAALTLGRAPTGEWHVLGPDQWDAVMPFRLPRLAAALCAGAMMAAAGIVLQRLTGNAMASPELLGVGAGATLGVAASLFLLGTLDRGTQLLAGAAGAGLVLLLIGANGRAPGRSPERMLLAGIALAALLDALVGVLSASGDPRAIMLLRWMSGSTYTVDAAGAALTALVALPLLGLTLMAGRWLDILPLGPAAAQALGLPVGAARLCLLALATFLTCAGALVIGPLSFVGLMAPHMAREMGLARAAPELLGAALIGATLMVAADWAGRMAAFPYQLPAGLVSALIGVPFLLLLFRRLRA